MHKLSFDSQLGGFISTRNLEVDISWNNKISEAESFGAVRGFDFKHSHEGFRYKYFSTHYLILTLVTIFATGWLMFLIKLV